MKSRLFSLVAATALVLTGALATAVPAAADGPDTPTATIRVDGNLFVPGGRQISADLVLSDNTMGTALWFLSRPSVDDLTLGEIPSPGFRGVLSCDDLAGGKTVLKAVVEPSGLSATVAIPACIFAPTLVLDSDVQVGNQVTVTAHLTINDEETGPATWNLGLADNMLTLAETADLALTTTISCDDLAWGWTSLFGDLAGGGESDSVTIPACEPVASPTPLPTQKAVAKASHKPAPKATAKPVATAAPVVTATIAATPAASVAAVVVQTSPAPTAASTLAPVSQTPGDSGFDPMPWILLVLLAGGGLIFVIVLFRRRKAERPATEEAATIE